LRAPATSFFEFNAAADAAAFSFVQYAKTANSPTKRIGLDEFRYRFEPHNVLVRRVNSRLLSGGFRSSSVYAACRQR